MAPPDIYTVAGLGNPGKNYARTRHNIGFMAADALAERGGGRFSRSRFNLEYTKVSLARNQIFVVKPQSYMNRSGYPLQRFVSYFRIALPHLIVIHDDIDLLFGRVKIVKARGHGGHNGVRSIIEALGTNDFLRVRVGVGRPGGEKAAVGHVLGEFSAEEQTSLGELVEKTAAAALKVIEDGAAAAMSSCNTADPAD